MKKPVLHFDLQADFHGLNAEEAVCRLERLIYAHAAAGILLVHGKGDGVLRKRIRAYLKKARLVRKVHYGEELNLPGGDGVTVVYTE